MLDTLLPRCYNEAEPPLRMHYGIERKGRDTMNRKEAAETTQTMLDLLNEKLALAKQVEDLKRENERLSRELAATDSRLTAERREVFWMREAAKDARATTYELADKVRETEWELKQERWYGYALEAALLCYGWTNKDLEHQREVSDAKAFESECEEYLGI